jgi:hypothetical protein
MVSGAARGAREADAAVWADPSDKDTRAARGAQRTIAERLLTVGQMRCSSTSAHRSKKE